MNPWLTRWAMVGHGEPHPSACCPWLFHVCWLRPLHPSARLGTLPQAVTMQVRLVLGTMPLTILHMLLLCPCTSLIRQPFQGIINLCFDFDVFSCGCCIGFRSMPCTCPISSAALFAKILDKGKTAFYSCLPTSTIFNLQSHREFSHAANQSHYIPTFSLLSQVPHNKSRVALPKSISSAFSRQTIWFGMLWELTILVCVWKRLVGTKNSTVKSLLSK